MPPPPVEDRADRRPTADERTVDRLHAATGAPAEREDPLLEALRQVGLRPGRIGAVTAPALSCSTMGPTAPGGQASELRPSTSPCAATRGAFRRVVHAVVTSG